jgi:hypothetical protein
MQITKRQALELRHAINTLSAVNKESGFPLYDMGFSFNMSMATTLAKLKAPLEPVDKKRDDMAVEQKAANKDESILANIDEKWNRYLEEAIEVDLTPIARDQIACKGQSPTPMILDMLSPIIG